MNKWPYVFLLYKLDIICCVQILLRHLDEERWLRTICEISSGSVWNHSKPFDELHEINENSFDS